MTTPPPSRDAPLPDDPTWHQVAQTYLLALAVPVLLWTLANPVAGTALVSVVGVTGVAMTRVASLAACLRDCGGFVLEVGDVARVTVTQSPAEEACCST